MDDPTIPGLTFDRRRMFWLPVAALGVFGAFRADGEMPLRTSPFSWKEFLDAAEQTAKTLHSDGSRLGQDIYLGSIAALALRLDSADVPRAQVSRFGKLDPAVEFGINHRGVPFFAVEWRLAPGAVLPPHNHPNGSVCTVGLEGEARVRKFEVVGEAPPFDSRKKFEVREMSEELVAPGRVITLSSYRDNIHTFTAGKSGARGIDISTYHGPDVGFSFLKLDSKPSDAGKFTYAASWLVL